MEHNECSNEIAVVIPTHGREALIRSLLDSLQIASEYSQSSTEVYIIDSSPEDVAEQIRMLCAESDTHYIHHRNNVREKRNLGINQAQAPIVLFVDSDCVVAPDLLLEHQRGYADEITAGVIGVTKFVGADSHVWRTITKTSTLDAFSYAEKWDSVPWGPTCNISYRKRVLKEMGGFDTSFPFPLGGDDTDLGLRVTAAGYEIKCNPKAVVEHTRETWSGMSLIGNRVFRWGRMHFHLMAKHPDRVYYDFPTVAVLFLLFALIIIPVAVIEHRPALLLLPILWLGLELLLESLLQSRLPEYTLREFVSLLGARILSLTFEIGTLFEALCHRSHLPMYREISYTPPSLMGRNRRIIQIWASVMALLAILLVGLTL